MIVFSVVFFGMFLIAVVIAVAITTARKVVHRHRCYRRAAIRSLTRSAREAAITRYYGRV